MESWGSIFNNFVADKQLQWCVLDDDNFEPTDVTTPAPALTNKWEGEDEDDEVKVCVILFLLKLKNM